MTTTTLITNLDELSSLKPLARASYKKTPKTLSTELIIFFLIKTEKIRLFKYINIIVLLINVPNYA